MNTDKIKQLYQKVILQHDRHPIHFEKRPDAVVKLEAYNPVCGDRFTLYLDIENDIITRASFHGYGCAISKAATSVLVSRMEGCSIVDVQSLCDQYLTLLDPEAPAPKDGDEELAAFLGARQFPARRSCASLSWEALRKHLEERASSSD